LYNRGAWIVQDTNLTANINLNDIYNYSGVTVSVGTAGKIITSQDGTNWSLVDSTIDLSYETGLPFTAIGNSTFLLFIYLFLSNRLGVMRQRSSLKSNSRGRHFLFWTF
jgi:hypothetical protein